MSFKDHDVTTLLEAWSGGEEGAGEELMARVYSELRLIAERCLKSERSDHSLDPTALVHEAYLRLIDQSSISWQGRDQFFALAARMMRRILVDHARRQRATKRGGSTTRVTLTGDVADHGSDTDLDELLALDEALDQLAELDAVKASIVEMRFFSGLEMREIARHQELSLATVHRHWRSARAWLYHRLHACPEGSELAATGMP